MSRRPSSSSNFNFSPPPVNIFLTSTSPTLLSRLPPLQSIFIIQCGRVSVLPSLPFFFLIPVASRIPCLKHSIRLKKFRALFLRFFLFSSPPSATKVSHSRETNKASHCPLPPQVPSHLSHHFLVSCFISLYLLSFYPLHPPPHALFIYTPAHRIESEPATKRASERKPSYYSIPIFGQGI